jgi:hypothetical protein
MRLPALVAAALVLAACAGGAPRATAPDGVRCPRFPALAGVGGGPPAAVLHDVAAGPLEYALGAPGAAPPTFTVATASEPVLLGDALYVTLAAGSTGAAVRWTRGGCDRIAAGAVTSVAPDGSRLVLRNDAGALLLVDAHGRLLAKPPLGTALWTGDGRLVVQAGSPALSVYGPSGHPVRAAAQGQLAGVLGTSSVILVTTTATTVMNLDGGPAQPVAAPRLYVPSGSPDGRYLAGVDYQTGQALVVDLQSGRTAALPAPGLTSALLWSPDSRWLAVDGVYGGYLVQAGDWAVTDLGPFVVASW